MNTIISKRTNNIEIIEYRMDAAAHRLTPLRSVTIFGGAGIMDPTSFVTPEGVATEVSDEALEWLMKQPKFLNGIKAGIFLVFDHRDKKSIDVDEVASSGRMEDNDKIPGRPLTPDKLVKEGAVINKDGSIDITEGGKDAPATIALDLDNSARKKRDFSPKKKGAKGKKAK